MSASEYLLKVAVKGQPAAIQSLPVPSFPILRKTLLQDTPSSLKDNHYTLEHSGIFLKRSERIYCCQ